MSKRMEQLSWAFKNSLLLQFPGLSRLFNDNESVMTGLLPTTSEWMDYDPDTASSDPDEISRLFHRRHQVAQERAQQVRSALKRTTISLNNHDFSIPIAMSNPDLRLVGCVGASMKGSGFGYMDIVAVLPAFAEPEVSLYGEPALDPETGHAVYHDFRIDIGNGIYLFPHSVAELNFLEDVVAEALKSCPEDMSDWAVSVRKLRHIEGIKVKPDGEMLLCVSMNRGELRPGKDHPIGNIRGRAIAKYSRTTYEPILKNAGVWDNLSFAAQNPDLLNPENQWPASLSDRSNPDSQILMAALLNRPDANFVKANQIVQNIFFSGSGDELILSVA